MPELPEVEVVCRGLRPLLVGHRIVSTDLFRDALRYPFPLNMQENISGLSFESLSRRAKYIRFHLSQGLVLLWHLGMTGQFHLLDSGSSVAKHEHVRIRLDNGKALCYRDTRRFGYAGMTSEDELAQHPWLSLLGPEPLSDDFDAACLRQRCRGSRAPIKSLLMNAGVVVGVGNIYASESLFISGVHPARKAGDISLARLERLVESVKAVLERAIEAGGSSINDFVKADGKPGYFSHQFQVYGREGRGCTQCERVIRRIVQSGRSTFYCPGCQR